jgi:hypothetical protein
MTSPDLPSPHENCFWILELPGEDPDHRDVQQLDCAEAPGALVVFTSREGALRFRDDSLGSTWILTGMTRDEVTKFLADMHDLGAERVAIDPLSGRENQADRIFDAIVRLT